MDSPTKYRKYTVTQPGDNGEKASTNGRIGRSSLVCLLVSIAIVTLVCALAVALGVGIGVPLSQSNSEQTGDGDSRLTGFSITETKLEGTYQGTYGSIYFKTTVNSTHVIIMISTPGGEPIISVVHPQAMNMTMMSVNHTNFMIMENRPGRPKYDDYIVPQDSMDMMLSIMTNEMEMTDDMMVEMGMDNSTVNETREEVFSQLVSSEEAMLIIEAAQAIGNLGIMGSEYPSAMHFYQLALKLTAGSNNTAEVQIDDSSPDTGENPRQKRQRVRRCSHDRYPWWFSPRCSSNVCPYDAYGNRCFGRCGYGCQCWWWICGTCCIHQYCLTHDLCCAVNGFWTWPCLRVVWDDIVCHRSYSC